MPGPEREPGDPSEEPDAERERRLRRLVRPLQAGGIAFLVVVSLGLLPTIASSVSPALGRWLSVAVWFAAPAVGVGLLVVAAVRLRR
jgi:hypothetical protein